MLVEVDGPDLFADGNYHQAECWGQGTAHWAASALTDTFLSKSEGLHVQSRFDQFWDVLDENLSGDVETTECASFYDVARVVRFARIN